MVGALAALGENRGLVPSLLSARTLMCATTRPLIYFRSPRPPYRNFLTAGLRWTHIPWSVVIYPVTSTPHLLSLSMESAKARPGTHPGSWRHVGLVSNECYFPEEGNLDWTQLTERDESSPTSGYTARLLKSDPWE